jgi:uncharacterized glyoxalase superfamily protein PhnB
MAHPTVFPTMSYDDAGAALSFLESAFGAEQHGVYRGDDGTIQHAEVRLGNGIVMFGSARGDAPATRGGGGGIYVVIEDPDAHCDRARAAGAEILRELHDTEYGSRDYSARDPEGNVWHFGTYQPFAFDHAAAEAEQTTA